MKPRTLAILTVITLALLLIGVSVYTKRSAEFIPDAPESLYPDLEGRVNDIARIRIHGPSGEFHIDRDEQGVWRMREKGGYPVRTSRIRAAALTLADLKVIAPKTRKSENYARIGVEDPAEPDAKSVLVQMWDDQGEELVSIVLGGIERGLNTSRRYVRLTSDPQAYFIEGVAEVEPDPARWIDREILRVPRAFTHEVVITHPDGERVRVYRDNLDARDFILDNVPEGAEFDDERDINLIGQSFMYIGMEEVAPLDEGEAEAPGPVARVRTFDGFVMTARLFDVGDATWAAFEASAEPPMLDVDEVNESLESSAEQERTRLALRSAEEIERAVREYNEKIRGWRFQLTESKTGLLSMRMQDLLLDEALGPVGP